MARRRMIDPEFFLDPEMGKLSAEARLMYIGTWGLADDNYATLPDEHQWIKIQTFPYSEINSEKILNELVNSGKLIRFETEEDGKKWLYIKNFHKYQVVNRPSKPKYPRYPHGVFSDISQNPHSEVKLSKVKLSKDNIDHLNTTFEEFWSVYPRKAGKKRARELWYKLNPSSETLALILASVGKARGTPQWREKDGQYIPHPSTYLNQERWNDEVPTIGRPKSIDLTK